MRIYLVGYMASGKSKVGSSLAERLGYSFYDLDDLFEERYRITIYDFFEKYGESNFRNIERDLLHETGHLNRAVISTGGGTPCFFDNMVFIKDSGYSIYLRWNIPSLVFRLRNVRRKRPVLKEFAGRDLSEAVTGHLKEREVFYNQADFIYEAETDDLDGVVSWINLKMEEEHPFS
jgi:shikimate kinase